MHQTDDAGRPRLRHVSTDGQALGPQVEQLRAAGAVKVYRETASGVKRDWAQPVKLLNEVELGDVVLDPAGGR